ncbi:MAG: AAA family ATPase [Deltaproteobacteria bacterium]|nr:AAA family ATPase [Deltaproteobacteria bacterium]
MERIAFYGKGGIGKSTIAAGVSMALARSGKRVLHVGCDPKHDSCLSLLPAGTRCATVIDALHSTPAGSLLARDFVHPGKDGIDCVESGGPQSGVGCGGRAVSRMFDLFDQLGLLDQTRYDAVVFDVLGDVVCGGFAAPLRARVAPKVAIVLSEEMMAAYAACMVSRAVLHYLDNGVCLAGLVVNRRDNRASLAPVNRLAEALDTRILVEIPRSRDVLEAELDGRSVIETAPRCNAARALQSLAQELFDLDPSACRPPGQVDLETLRALMRTRAGET